MRAYMAVGVFLVVKLLHLSRFGYACAFVWVCFFLQETLSPSFQARPSASTDSSITLRLLLPPPADSSQQCESHINMIALRERGPGVWVFFRPTFHTASSSHMCGSVCEHVFIREGSSEDLYSGRLMPPAHEHICLSRPCCFTHVCMWAREVQVNSKGWRWL